MEKHRGAVPAAGRRGLCQCRAAAGNHHFSGLGTGQAGDGAATPDEPLGNATAPRLLYFSNAPGGNETGAINGPIVVEVCINDAGEVYDYRIVSGPTDATTRSQVENLLLFSRFAPARFFGQPVRGLAVLSFSGVSVRG